MTGSAAYRSRTTIVLGLMIGLAMGLHLFEYMLPLPYLFPGAKLGLANIVTLFVVLNYGLRSAVVVSILRTLLSSLLIGTFLNVTFFLSFSGALASALVMGAVHHLAHRHVSIVALSIVGAFTHNVAQIIAAAYFVGTLAIFLYLPYLLVFALPTGLFVGLVTNQMQRMRHFR